MSDNSTSAHKHTENVPIGDGWSSDTEGTVSCYCGAVQAAFPLRGPDRGVSFVCNCQDCRKVTATMTATNFMIRDSAIRHIRGEDNLSTYSTSKTIESQSTMTNHFCKTCGTLMYRRSDGQAGWSFMRVGTIDDVSLHETLFKPTVESFVRNRVSWLVGGEQQGMKQYDGAF